MSIQAFDYSIDVMRSLLWRHNEAENLKAIISNKKAALDELNNGFWSDWFDDVFNLQTANDFGLSVWAFILDIPLTIDPDPPATDNSNFGFGPFRKNFNNGNFSSSTSWIVLNTEEARLVLKLRFYQLITRATIPECNRIVKEVFAEHGTVYALDGLDMTMTYVFLFVPPVAVRVVITKYDLLPRPSGVKLNILYNANGSFGFGSFRKNFNNGNFRA